MRKETTLERLPNVRAKAAARQGRRLSATSYAKGYHRLKLMPTLNAWSEDTAARGYNVSRGPAKQPDGASAQ